ncbi:MAG TPA: YdeI/OmpD-associated family protein, partial [Candidatus Angelobacter sp.]|nr:YdeI/OmpD-associated family protein [Candidatus Angelobacter sp.]
SMASFKEHCAFGFWKGSLIIDGKENKSVDAMGQFGRITSRQDLPAKRVLLGYIKKAMQLNDEGVKAPARSKPKTGNKELKVPEYFLASLKKNKKALAAFEGFPYSKKKEYVEWVTEAKAEETRERRLATSVEWLAEGKSRNWKYERC